MSFIPLFAHDINSNAACGNNDIIKCLNKSMCKSHWIGNCTKEERDQANRDSNELWKIANFCIFTLWGICLISCFMILFIFSHKKYRKRLLPRILSFMYVINMLYVGFMALSNGGIPLSGLSESFDPDLWCRCCFVASCILRTLANWLLVITALIHVFSIFFRGVSLEYRQRPKILWSVIAGAGIIASPSLFTDLLEKYNQEQQRFVRCSADGRLICMFRTPIYFDILTHAVPVFASAFCVISIACSMFNKKLSVASLRDEHVFIKANRLHAFQRANRLLFGTTLQFTVIELPLLFSRFEVDVKTEPCNDDSQYDMFSNHVAYVLLSMLLFSVDGFILICVSDTFRRDLQNCSPCLPGQFSTFVTVMTSRDSSKKRTQECNQLEKTGTSGENLSAERGLTYPLPSRSDTSV